MNSERLADRAKAPRAIAVALLTLAVVGALDVSALEPIRPFDALFHAGEASLALLFVCSGWVSASRLLAARTVGSAATARVLLVHAVPTVVLLVLVSAVLALVPLVDPKFAGVVGSRPELADGFLKLLLDPLARHDAVQLVVLTPLAFLVAELALVIVTTVVVALLGRYPTLIGWAALLGAAGWWTVAVLVWERPETIAMQLPVWPHVAAFLAGVAAVSLRGRVKDEHPVVAGSGLLVLVGCVVATAFLKPMEYEHWVAPAVILSGVCLLVSDPWREPRQLSSRFSVQIEVVKTGEAWRSAVAWSGCVAVLVWAHTLTAPGFARWAFTVIAVSLVAAASESVTNVVSERAARLGSPDDVRAISTSVAGAPQPGHEDG